MSDKSKTASTCCGSPSQGLAGIDLLRSEMPESSTVESVANLLAMAGNPVRLQLLLALSRRDELCVCDLSEVVRMSSAAVSAHLQKLKMSGLVQSRRDGQMIRYSLARRAEMAVLESLLDPVEAQQ